eukprot:SAG25_NODE_2361_length_1681_cov_1.463970_2_plen_67_part_00
MARKLMGPMVSLGRRFSAWARARTLARFWSDLALSRLLMHGNAWNKCCRVDAATEGTLCAERLWAV